jgi:hypothetical protein
MEYLIGAAFSAVLFFGILLFVHKTQSISVDIIKYRQSHIVHILAMTEYEEHDKDEFYDKESPEKDNIKCKVVFLEDKAYWLDGSEFFVADARGDTIMTKTKRQVDTMSMSAVELKQIAKVVEALRSDNEDRDSG